MWPTSLLLASALSLFPTLSSALFAVSDPNCADTDGDTLCDDEDPCVHFVNTLPLVITGFSGIPDECLCGDFDGDGLHSAIDAAAINDCAAFINSNCVPERDDHRVASPSRARRRFVDSATQADGC